MATEPSSDGLTISSPDPTGTSPMRQPSLARWTSTGAVGKGIGAGGLVVDWMVGGAEAVTSTFSCDSSKRTRTMGTSAVDEGITVRLHPAGTSRSDAHIKMQNEIGRILDLV